MGIWNNTRRTRRGVLVLLLLVVVLGSCSGPAAEPHLVQMYSLRGSLLPTETDGVYTGGMGLVAGAINQIRVEHSEDPFILLGTYNITFGTPEAFVTDGMPIIDLMNLMGFSALIVGVREFYFGPDVLEQQAVRAAFPFLAANIANRAGAPLSYLRGSFLHEESGVGIIGLAPPQLIEQNLAEHVADIQLTDPVAAAAREVQVLQLQGAREIWLVAGGFGLHRDNGPDPQLQQFVEVPGVDLVIGGAAPDSEPGLHGVPGFEAKILAVRGDNGVFGREIDHFDASDDSYSVIPVSSDTVRTPDYIEPALTSVYSSTRALLDRTISYAPESLSHDFEQESQLGNFFTDILREHLELDVVLVNAGGMRIGFDAGPVTVGDVYTAYPFGGNLVLFEATGAQLKEMVRQSLGYIGRPERGRGFLQVSGISFAYRGSSNGFSLVEESVRVGGEALAAQKLYRVGAERYVFNGGDGYTAFDGIQASEIIPESTLSILLQLVEEVEEIPAKIDGRIERR